VHSIRKSTEATGLGNVLGNKGGTVVSFGFHDLSMCFVNTHLAAHQDQTKRRNADVASVVSGINLGKTQKMDILNSYHHVFWMGDLNYRLDYGGQGDEKEPSPEQHAEMVSLIKQKKYSELFQYDQLTAERNAKHVFYGFNEGQYNFPPTFKVARGTEDIEYNPKRSPAWTDRILWRSFPGFVAKQTSLKSCDELTTSDHKPVSAIFAMERFELSPAIDPLLGPATLKITNLACQDLPVGDVTGSSDPFIRFSGDFVVGGERETKHMKKTLNPKWDNKDVPDIPLSVNSRKRLQASYLSVRVFDWDLGSSADLLCSGVIPIAQCLGGEPFKFNFVLSRGGVPKGSISGVLSINYGESTFFSSV
jgi:endonuclease/exonuclease/phosphatase family metal-dependent hydrolase